MLSGVLLTVISLFILWLFKKLRAVDTLAHINGPKGVPVLGNAPELSSASSSHLKLTEWSKQYGPVYKIHLMSRPVIIVSGYKEIFDVLVRKGKDFAGRTSSYRIKEMMENKSDFLSLDFSSEYQYRRKIFQSHLKQYGEGVKRIEDVTINSVNDFISQIQGLNGKAFEVVELIQNLIIDITYTIALGKKQESENEREAIVKMTSLMNNIISASGTGFWLDIFPWLRFFGFHTYKELVEMRKIRQILHSSWDRSSEDNIADKESNLVYKMKRLMKIEGKLNETNIEVLTMTLFLGATTTTVGTLSFLINALSQHPHIQHRLQNESDSTVGSEGEIRFKDREKLPYHYATILETLRMSTVLPLAIPHKTLIDSDICGQYVPKGCTIMLNLWGLHHDDNIWDEPFEFRPERFLSEDGVSILPPDHRLRMSLMSFSAGPRVCSGEMFATTRMLLSLAKLMQNFTILPETTQENQASCDPRDMKLGGVLMPNPFKVRFIDRKR